MKDAYSFDLDEEGLSRSYEAMVAAYLRIFERCGLSVQMIEANPGVMGGGKNQEFVLPSDDGETDYALCGNCDFGANLEVTDSKEERCPRCGGQLSARIGIELGHVFQLGTKYSEAMGAWVLDRLGASSPLQMGCYGLGISRMVAAVVDANHDEAGIKWPRALAPKDAIVLLLSQDPTAITLAEQIYEELTNTGVSAILDDRDVSAGVKFSDADLIGYPVQAIIGRELTSGGRIEVRKRATGESTLTEISTSRVLETLAQCP